MAAKPSASASVSAAAKSNVGKSRKHRKSSSDDEEANTRSVVESRKLCSDDDVDDVNVVDIVALLDAASSCPEDASIFVGRIIKVREFEAQLMELGYVDESKSLYRAVAGSSWWESLDALIHPIDIVYDRSNQLYELHSSPADIFRVVRSV